MESFRAGPGVSWLSAAPKEPSRTGQTSRSTCTQTPIGLHPVGGLGRGPAIELLDTGTLSAGTDPCRMVFCIMFAALHSWPSEHRGCMSRSAEWTRLARLADSQAPQAPQAPQALQSLQSLQVGRSVDVSAALAVTNTNIEK
ncbi:hypothetical protein MBR_07622, partial [Metarhizium brunneum ARSEF 3297]